MSKREEIRERRRREQRRNLLVGAFIVAGLALIIVAIVILRTQATIRSLVVPEGYSYPEQVDFTAMGDPEAPVRIDEFSDFQCSACQYFHDETLKPVIETYVKTGQVYFVYHNFPVTDAGSPQKESQAAAQASYCAAEQGRFWQYHDLLFANRIGENVGGFTTARLEAMGEALGLGSEFKQCLRKERYRDRLIEDIRMGQEAGVNSTPSFLINGQLVVGAMPFARFQIEIENALAR